MNKKIILLTGLLVIGTTLWYSSNYNKGNLKGLADGEFGLQSCDKESSVRSVLTKHLGKYDFQYELVRLPGNTLKKSLDSGKQTSLPLMNSKNKLSLFSDKTSISNKQLVVAALVDGKSGTSTTEEQPFVGYNFGCDKDAVYCGKISFLDSKNSKYEIAVTGPELGLTAIESIDSFLNNLTGKNIIVDPSCAIAYNSNGLQFPLRFDHHGDDEHTFPDSAYQQEMDRIRADLEARHARREIRTKQIPIVLDGDAAYRDLNPETVWTRQLSLLDGVNLIYSVIEPLSTGLYDIEFTVKGQQAFRTGTGPTTLDKEERVEEINAEDYPIISQLERDEVSFHFVGSDMTGGIAGVAGSICNDPTWWGAEGYGTQADNQRLHAWGQQVRDSDGGYAFSTFLGRITVAAHEIGHMLGAVHDFGLREDCAGGSLPTMCGNTIMLSGASGGLAPDERQPFFSYANDEMITRCVFY